MYVLRMQCAPDFARVTTGKETPAASAREVNAFAHTCVTPDKANMSYVNTTIKH